MKILVTQIVGIGSFARALMLDALQTLIDQYPEAEIFHLTCSNSFSVCYTNTSSKPEQCYLCKKGTAESLKLIKGNFKHLIIDDLIQENDIQTAEEFISRNKQISKDLIFENFKVGESSLSSYISKTRDRDLIGLKESFTSDLVKNGIILYKALDRFLSQNSIDLIYNFNGRHTYHRAVMSLGEKFKIPYYNLESARPGGYLEIFKKALPQNIKSKQTLVQECWSQSSLTHDEKSEIGTEFFKSKIEGRKIHGATFTDKQVKNFIPNEIDSNKRSVVLFTSSDDEFAAVGKEYDNPFFKDQNEGIFYVAKLFQEKLKDFNLIVRMHPNLTGVNHDYVEKLRNIEKEFPNVILIPPESSVDSYALMDMAEKIVVFGSTIAVESNFWGKPVVLLGKGFYYGMDIAYEPSNHNEIQDLLTKKLKPKDKLNSLKFGFYFLNGGVPAQYYDQKDDGSVFFKGNQIYNFSLNEKIKAKMIKLTHQYIGLRLFVK